MCVTFVVFTYCESCTRPISTNPGSMEAGQYGLTRVTCFLAWRLELDAVAGLLWMDFVVRFGWGGGFFRVFFPSIFFFLRTHTACCKHEAASCLIYLSTSNPHRAGWCNYVIFYQKLENISCEYDRLNGWNSTLQAAWYIRHVRIRWFLWTKPTIWLLIISFTKYRTHVFHVLSLWRI